MEIDITTPALLFPAITLLLLAYTNRFIALANVIRTLRQKLGVTDNNSLIRQIENLSLRINLIRIMQALGITSLLGCVITMFLLFINMEFPGRLIFAVSLGLMVISLLVSLWEIMLSGNALHIELEGMRKSGNFNDTEL
ncbi:MAG TPA: DUF2721 domain-containing protein [Gammaproteobacteria bacterium]